MAHGVGEVLSENNNSVKLVNNSTSNQNANNQTRKPVGVMGSRRIFAAAFKLKVLDSYRNDIDCRGNQRATARKYGIHRRQIQKWLQCEENLRSSCAESTSNNGVIVNNNNNNNHNNNNNNNHNNNNNNNIIIATTSNIVNSAINIISTMAIAKTAEPTVVTTSSVMTPAAAAAAVPATAAPALNLSLARLHGDELAGRQGPPPSHPTLHRGGCSPTYTTPVTNPLPMHALLIGYSDYAEQDLHHHPQHQLLHHRPEDVTAMPSYPIDHAGSPNERKYYVLSHPAYEQSVASGYRGGSDAKLYHQPQQQQHQPQSDSYQNNHGYNSIAVSGNRDNRILGSSMHQSPTHVQQSIATQLVTPLSSVCSSSSSTSSHSHMRDVESPGNEPLVPAIKTERASPDSLATPVACSEPPSSPSITATTTCTRLVYPANQHTHTSGIATQATIPQAVHYAHTPHTTETASHVHVSVDSHTVSGSKKRELMYVKRENDEEIRIKDEMQDVCAPKAQVGNERREEKRAIDERDASNYGGNVLSLSRSNSEVASGTMSPARESGYSGPSSPREVASSSSRSTVSSCSDSEIDPLDYSSGHHNPTNDLSRRRSFSLRFKLDVLDAFHNDAAVAGNQRATARKFGINRRQVQKWLGQETDLRGEIALRGGDLRQRLGPLQELPESAVDLRTASSGRSDVEMDPSSPAYCCDSSSQRLGYYTNAPMDSELSQRTCTLSCCADNLTASSMASCYPESRRSCYPESQGSYYCYSPRDPLDTTPSDSYEMTPSPLKRPACTLSCCYDTPSPKRLCTEATEIRSNSTNNKESNQDQPPQEAPLCLVKTKRTSEPPTLLQTERVTSTVPTPPAPTSKKDAILFKPYLDNPVSKPIIDETHQKRDQSPISNHQSVIVNNNNCTNICNLNEERGHDYAVELSLRVPVSWRAPSHVTEFPERIRSAFARYPATPHYI